MKAGDALAMSFSNLLRRKGRTILTMVGVVIGVAALVMIVSLGIGLEREVVKLFQGEETIRTMAVSRRGADGSSSEAANPFDFFGSIAIPLTDADLAEIRDFREVAFVRPVLSLALKARIQEEPKSTTYFEIGGVLAEEEQRLARMLVHGSMWKDRAERVVLIPSRMIGLRYGKEPHELVGRHVVFTMPGDGDDEPKELSYRVVGILDTGQLGHRASRVLMPMEQALELRDASKGGILRYFAYQKGEYLGAEVVAKTPELVEPLKRQLANSGYQVLPMVEMLSMIRTVFLIFEGFLACTGAIGLIVSLFGIANTMATAVLERTREIGIMKALGARNSDISRVFLLEAAAIGVLGGMLGLAIGVGGGSLLDLFAHKLSKNLPSEVHLFYVSPWLALGSLFFSMAVSLVAGWMPALRAARLVPARALRYE